jgi:ribosomal protein S16
MNIRTKYEPYIKSLLRFLAENGYTKKPYPSIVLNNKRQDCDEAFIRTGYYDPENKQVVVFTNGRNMKDVLRSFAHECVHHKQNLDGRLGKGAYSGDRIVDDKKLINLELEAFRDGNLGFRKWTETTNLNPNNRGGR